MKRIISFILLLHFASVQYGQIIADHTVVDKFDDIPQYYIDQVKKMWLTLPGESHSYAYRYGLTTLEALFPTYAVLARESGTPDGYTTEHLRVSRATWGDYDRTVNWIYNYGEEDWFTNSTAVSRTKAGITYANTHDLTISAIGFAWCGDHTAGEPTIGTDPVYGVHWYGVSINGPDGNKAWGIDGEDYPVTQNSVCMDTYLGVTQDYIDYCKANGYSTKVFFTTGPVESASRYYGEIGYQGHLKWERIREYVRADPTRILFDYADILCYDDDGSVTTSSWNGHTYPIITPTNQGDATIGHISEAGAIRLAKAMWWMLARIAGWDGGVTYVDNSTREESEIWTEIRGSELKVYLSGDLFSGKSDLYALDGSLIASKHIYCDLISFDTSNFPSGFYILAIRRPTGIISKKIILP